ncbi:hypothetical protein V5799_024599 [Amblyomma americanum]|uniref:CCHC-type domain-containing protein n=1 Tax=Amblyomma americanum TaxID=6943 RepID=A0AAQ4EBJ9_AMBAM
MPTYGALEPLYEEGGTWTEYLERVKLFFDANSVPAEKQRSVFLTCCGSSTYSLLRSLLTPKTPDQVSIDKIFSVLSGHYIPKPSVVVCRFRFNSHSRQPEESVSDYTASPKKLSANCECGTFLPDMLQDRLVCGINDASMQRRLLEEPNLTFESPVKLLIAMETAKRDSSMLMQAQGMTKAQTAHSAMSKKMKQTISCYRCGEPHYATVCQHAKSRCNACSKIGHLARVCRSKGADMKQENVPMKHSTQRQTKQPVHSLGDSGNLPEIQSQVYKTWQMDREKTIPPFVAVL